MKTESFILAHRRCGRYAWLLLAAAASLSAHVWAAPGDAAEREGGVVWLEETPDAEAFPALYAQAETPRGAIVLLHDLYSFVDDPRMFKPLREQLVAQGYDVFAPRLPIRRADVRDGVESAARYTELLQSVERRAQRSLEFMHTQGRGPLILLGHGYGGFAAVLLLGREGPPPASALIVISPHWYAHPQGMRTYVDTLSRLPVPVLDIHPEVEEETGGNQRSDHLLRLTAMKSAGAGSRQVGIPYTDHNMRSMIEPVVRVLNHWLTLPNAGPELVSPAAAAATDAGTD